MLNPSTADETTDDPTIRKCMGFGERWGGSELIVVNLYAFRATDPRELLWQSDPIGSENWKYIDEALTRANYFGGIVVGAWGAFEVGAALQKSGLARKIGLRCLGKNKNGSPKHPLYVPYSQQLEVWP